MGKILQRLESRPEIADIERRILQKEGTLNDIAKAYGVSRETIHRHKKKMKLRIAAYSMRKGIHESVARVGQLLDEHLDHIKEAIAGATQKKDFRALSDLLDNERDAIHMMGELDGSFVSAKAARDSLNVVVMPMPKQSEVPQTTRVVTIEAQPQKLEGRTG